MALLIDTRELARTGRALEGTLDVSDLPRLASLLVREEGQLHWQARGERRQRADGGHDDLLHVELASEVHMQCVRCLAEAPVELQVVNAFRLVASDEQAEREDLEDSEFDVLVGGVRFDLGELIEDEAILGLPSLPQHEHCELPGALDAELAPADQADRTEDSAERIHPFADLAERIKRRH